MIELRQSTAVSVPVGPLVNSTTGAPETALTISQSDVRLKKNGGNWAQKNESSNSAHEEDGMYECALDTTDTDTLGQLELKVDESGTLVHTRSYGVISQAHWDAKYASTPLPVNATQISGDSTAADNAEAMFDGTGYAGGTIKLLTESATTDTVKLALIIRENTAQAGVAGSITLDASASSVTDFYKNQLIVITSGTGVGQARFVSAYNGTTKVATVAENWATTPDGTSVFKVLSIRAADSTLSTSGIADAVWDEAVSGHNSAGTFGKSLSDIRQRHAGKVRMNSQTGVLTIYETDGTTTRFTLTKAAVDGVTSDLTPS